MNPLRTLSGRSLMLVVTLSFTPLALAATTADQSDQRIGDATRNLLQQQRSGKDASPVKRPPAADVAERSYQRYLDSFSQPIPKSFASERQSFSSSSK